MVRFNFRFIFKTIGFLLIIESLFMMMATLVSFYSHEMAGDAMLISSALTLFFGIFFRLAGTDDYEKPISKRESFLSVTLASIVMSAFGMLPYYISGYIPNVCDAYFETISGFTSTGASILSDIEVLPRGLLFWRSITQWIGGIGIIVFALTVLPMVGGNASALYDAEATGIMRERFRPRVSQISKRLWTTYIVITTIVIFLLWLGPMNLFDSVCHALTTISTDGFSTKQESIGYWNSAYVEYVVTIFMFIGGTNFALVFYLFKGMPQKLLKDEEFRWYVSICVILIIIIVASLFVTGKSTGIEPTIRTSLFHVVSVITTTGFTTTSYISWGAFYVFLFCLLMLFCACAGSTSGGVKIVRIIVLFKNAINEFRRQVQPNAILPVRLNGQVIPIDVVTKMLAFIFLYLAILVSSFIVLSWMGMGFEESIGAGISCLGNTGSGLGVNGANGHFADISEPAKWYLCFLMLTGRLELFTVLSLFMPAFWRK